MQIEKYRNSQTFGANLNKEFIDFARSYINTKPNKLKNNYKLNNKIDDFKNFGHDYLTIGLYQKHAGYGDKYMLVARKEGQKLKEGTVIACKDSFNHLLKAFLGMKKKEFITRLYIGKKYKSM